MLSFSHYLCSVTVFVIAVVANSNLEARADCADNFSQCSPRGASSSANTPSVGTELSPLYTDLLTSVNGAKKSKRASIEAGDELNLLVARASSTNLCCADGTLCLLLQGLNLPFCYDNYTTNYFLPGGATGQIVSGDYSSTGGQANLISGNYTLADGTTGNVYGSEDAPERPNTSTLPIPTQYTAAGSFSVIPATALGQVITVTTTFPGTTVEPSTMPPTTVEPSTVEASGTSIVLPASTMPGSTIPGTTVAAKTSTYTTTAAAGTSTAEGAAAPKNPAMSGAAGLGFLLFAIFGL
ncbi:MAG: hypothetical protein Q9216_000180 [Gyalolechia sp. 2 TL-2023]